MRTKETHNQPPSQGCQGHSCQCKPNDPSDLSYLPDELITPIDRLLAAHAAKHPPSQASHADSVPLESSGCCGGASQAASHSGYEASGCCGGGQEAASMEQAPGGCCGGGQEVTSVDQPSGGCCGGAADNESGGCCGGAAHPEPAIGLGDLSVEDLFVADDGSSLADPHAPAGASSGVSRRQTLGGIVTGLLAGLGLSSTGCGSAVETAEQAKLNWSEYFKKNYRVMTDEEKQKTVARLVRKAELRREPTPGISTKAAIPGVLYGYAFNVSKCKGYMDCVKACIKENNLDRRSNMQYIRIFEVENDKLNPEHGSGQIDHEVPAAGHVYMGTQCFQCENPPCVKVCPVGATWREPDGIVVIDYDWCIGCRYCQSACPYWARRFNWETPEVPKAEINPKQHYLGNRPRQRGVMEKCTFCIQRTREGQLPACAEACPTGARVFGNLLDPKSEIRYVLKHKKVFRLKEDLGAEPKFWYFMD